MDRFDDIPEKAIAWHLDGRGAALATVVETWGSAPRRVGGQLAVSGAGEIEGSVSGGCVEGAVVAEALDAIAEGRPKMLEYGVSDGDAFAAGLACGGRIRILVEPVGTALPAAVLTELVEARAARIPIACVTGIDMAPRLERTGHEERLRLDRSGFEDDGTTFVAVHNPPPRLIAVGAVHIAQALLPMVRLAGLDPLLIDPREGFASEARFPGESVVCEWPDEALRGIPLDARTGLVALTHDPKIDDPALEAAIGSEAFYIGALGSTRTHAARVARLRAKGHSARSVGRIRGPVGLDIGAATPSEIAVSVLAEAVAALRGGGALASGKGAAG